MRTLDTYESTGTGEVTPTQEYFWRQEEPSLTGRDPIFNEGLSLTLVQYSYPQININKYQIGRRKKYIKVNFQASINLAAAGRKKLTMITISTLKKNKCLP